jgi:hypothetical protein
VNPRATVRERELFDVRRVDVLERCGAGPQITRISFGRGLALVFGVGEL